MKESRGERVIDGESGDADENGDLAWPKKWACEALIERCGWGSYRGMIWKVSSRGRVLNIEMSG